MEPASWGSSDPSFLSVDANHTRGLAWSGPVLPPAPPIRPLVEQASPRSGVTQCAAWARPGLPCDTISHFPLPQTLRAIQGPEVRARQRPQGQPGLQKLSPDPALLLKRC